MSQAAVVEPVLLSIEDRIATITLNRPEKLNACNLDSWRRLGEILGQVNKDDTLRCIVLRGAGGKAFGAGADIAEFQEQRFSAAQAEVYHATMAPAIEGLRTSPHPLVALIEGPCIGGGLEIAMFCDLRIAGESARLGIPINRLGHILQVAELEELLALVGRAAAMEILLEGRILGADEALTKGFLTRVVPDGRVAEEAYATAKRIAAGAPLAARRHKALVRRILDRQALNKEEAAWGFTICDSADYREGVKAFLERRKPEFEGR